MVLHDRIKRICQEEDQSITAEMQGNQTCAKAQEVAVVRVAIDNVYQKGLR
jgi:hypothetical protein